MQLVMVTQYFDTLKSIGESDRTNTLFLAHSPSAVKEVSDPLLSGLRFVYPRGGTYSDFPATVKTFSLRCKASVFSGSVLARQAAHPPIKLQVSLDPFQLLSAL